MAKTCPKCGGSGTFKSLTSFGDCYPCNGTGSVMTTTERRAHAESNNQLAIAHYLEKLADAEQLLSNPFVTHYRKLGGARLDAANARHQLEALGVKQ